MITSDLFNYIKIRRDQGVSDELIYQELKNKGWPAKDLNRVLSQTNTIHPRIKQLTHSVQHILMNKWFLGIAAVLLLGSATAFYFFIIIPYSELRTVMHTMQTLSSVQYSGKTEIMLFAQKPAKTVTLSFHGVVNMDSAPTQTKVNITASSQGFKPDFQGSGDLIRLNQTTYINIHQLHNVPLVNPANTLNHWYIVSSDSAHLTSLQQLVPSLEDKHLVTITHLSTEKALRRIDFQISHNHLAQLRSTKKLDHIDGSLWIDQQHYIRRVVFSVYPPQTSLPSIHADVTLSHFNKEVNIKQPSSITDSDSGTSIYYLIKIIQSMLNP